MRATGDPRTVGGSEDARSSMSDEFDSLDATEKAAVEAALKDAKRPSDDVVQTAPVRCRYTKSGICAKQSGLRVEFGPSRSARHRAEHFSTGVVAVRRLVYLRRRFVC